MMRLRRASIITALSLLAWATTASAKCTCVAVYERASDGAAAAPVSYQKPHRSGDRWDWRPVGPS